MTKRESFRHEEKPPSLREVARRSRDGRSELIRRFSIKHKCSKRSKFGEHFVQIVDFLIFYGIIRKSWKINRAISNFKLERSTAMNQFCNQMFNPMYVNQSYYQSIQTQAMWQYQQNQDAEVQKAMKATQDLYDAVSKLDSVHQEQALYGCLAVLALKLGWNQ